MSEKNEARPDGIRITLRMMSQQRNSLRRAAEVAGVPVSTFVLCPCPHSTDAIVIQGLGLLRPFFMRVTDLAQASCALNLCIPGPAWPAFAMWFRCRGYVRAVRPALRP